MHLTDSTLSFLGRKLFSRETLEFSTVVQHRRLLEGLDTLVGFQRPT